MICILIAGVVAHATVVDDVSLQIASDNTAEILLNEYILGNNLTYDVNGSYFDSSGNPVYITPPTVSQGMKLEWSASKPMNLTNSFVPDAQNSTVYYSMEGKVLVAWSIVQFPAITQVASFAFQQYLCGIYPFVDANSESSILLLNYSDLNLTFYVATFVGQEVVSVPSLTVTYSLYQSFTRADFEVRGTNVYTYVQANDGESGYVAVFSMPISLEKQMHFVTNITAEVLGRPLSPVRYAGLGDIGFLCDYNGVFILSMLFIEVRPPTLLSMIGNSTDNHVLDCLVNNDLLLLSTTQGILNFTVFNAFQDFSINATFFSVNDPLNVTNGNLVLGTLFMQFQQQVVALYEISSTASGKKTNFKVLNTAADDLRQTVVVDTPTSNFLVDYEYDAFPAFALVIINETLYVMFDTYSELQVYRIHRSPTLTFTPNVTGGYSYLGRIYTNSAGDYSLSVTALDIHNANAVYARDPQPPLAISHYLGVLDHVFTDIYFPVSNYFFGSNLTYSITAYNSDFTSANRSVEIPPIVSFNQSIEYPFVSPLSRVRVLNVDGFTFMGVLTFNNEVEVFECQESVLSVSQLSTVQPRNLANTVLDFAFFADIDNSKSGVVLASNSTGGELVLDFFNLTGDGEPGWIATYSAGSKPLGKLEGYNGVVYAVVGSEILMIEFELSVLPTVYPARMISAKTIVPHIGQFTPLDFASSFATSYLLYVYEATLGLVFIDIDLQATSSLFQLQRAHYTANDPPAVRLISPEADGVAWVYVVGDTEEQLVQFTMNYTSDLPITGYYLTPNNCRYQAPVSAGNYIAVVCANETAAQVYIVDTTTLTPDSLVAAVPVQSNLTVAIAYLQSNQYHLYTYDGKTVTRYGLGQTAPSWKPVSQVFATLPGTTIWARVTLTFVSQPKLLQYLVPVSINATCWGCETYTANVTYLVVNPGTFIIVSNYSSIFSNGDPEDSTVFYSGKSIPLEQFIGLDIVYTLTINSNQMYQIRPLPSCDHQTNMVCLTSKYVPTDAHLDTPASANLTTFLSYQYILYFAYQNYIYVQGSGSVGTNLAISQQLDMNVSSCYLLAEVQNCFNCLNIIAAACIGVRSNGVSASIITLVNTTQGIALHPQEVDFLVVALSAVQTSINDEILMFVSDGTEMLVYSYWQELGVRFCSRISPASLKLNWLSPNSMQFVNDSNQFESLFVMGDQNYGAMFLRLIYDLGGQMIFYLDSIIVPEYGDSAVVALRVHTKNPEVYMLTKSGFFTQYDLEAGSYKMTVNPVMVPEFVPLVNVMAADSEFNYIAYLVIVSGTYNIRVLSILEDEWRSAAYTTIDTEIPYQADAQGSVQILGSGGETLTVALLIPGLLPYTVYSVNAQPEVFVIKTTRAVANFTMQIKASNLISSALGTPFTVYFSANDTDDNGPIAKLESIKHFYQMWWFWASIGFGLIISFTAAALLMIKYYGRKRTKRSLSVAMTEQIISIDRFSSLSVS